MKKLRLLSGFLLVLTPVLFSCRKEGCTDKTAINYDESAKKENGSCHYKTYTVEETNINGVAVTKYTGTLDESLTWTADRVYLISGAFYIDNEATLTIAAGTRILADDQTLSFLSVQRGSKINAQGTSDNPIVFSSAAGVPKPGDWGGIIINGYAPLNSGNSVDGADATGTYGGTLANDPSGILKYIRIEYAGKNSFAACSFRGVGDQTQADYLQAWYAAADGFEIRGGTLALHHVLAYGCGDDGVDWNEGWIGSGMYWQIKQAVAFGDQGISGANNNNDHYALPYAAPDLTFIELYGRDTSAHTTGLFLANGTKAHLQQVIIRDFYNGVQADQDATLKNVTYGDVYGDLITVTGAYANLLYTGTTDAFGNFIDPALVAQAYASGSIVVDGAASSVNWLNGTWYRLI